MLFGNRLSAFSMGRLTGHRNERIEAAAAMDVGDQQGLSFGRGESAHNNNLPDFVVMKSA